MSADVPAAVAEMLARWKVEASSGERFPLWRTLATTSSPNNEAFEAWLLNLVRDTHPERF